MAANRVPTPPPLHDLPTAKEKRYDRQLRLWGASGQVTLEEAHILLVNTGSGVTGIEALKNLVLPGVGQFSILDSATVSEEDLGVNFFLEDESLGKFRAEETVRLLGELNPDVRGHAITEPLESFLQKDDNLKPFTLLLVSAPIDYASLRKIRDLALASQTPLFYTHCIGFFSHFSIQLPPAFPVVDTHPDPTATQDLRLLKPWPELEDFAKRMTDGLWSMAQHDLGHVPYVCLLLHYIDKYRTQHGKLPESYKDKTTVRDMVRAEGKDEENFEEAYAAVLKSLNPPTIPSGVRDVLSAPETQSLTSVSSSFWLIANAIQQFVTKHSVLPLPGAVPDMKARSNDYITLQQIYKSKARADCAEVTASVRSLEKSTNRSAKLEIPVNEIENFCKNAAHIHLVRGRPLQLITPGEKPSFGDRAKALRSQLTNPESLIGLYLAFLAFDDFTATHTPPVPAHPSSPTGVLVPGASDFALEADAAKLTATAHTYLDALINESGNRLEDPEYSDLRAEIEKYCTEIARAGGAELHNMASLTGGLVSQEIIKVITGQYVGVDNVCLVEGVASRMGTLKV
nr:hypothetical protein B0A51_14443 [Rachicladosporium sp. CCFEE 5018]